MEDCCAQGKAKGDEWRSKHGPISLDFHQSIEQQSGTLPSGLDSKKATETGPEIASEEFAAMTLETTDQASDGKAGGYIAQF